MALISIQDVSLGFGGMPLLEDVNMQIESGEWVGLLGRNGMGKSTLLKLISGEIVPLRGMISPLINFSNVDFPIPFRPSKPTHSPLSICIFTSSRSGIPPNPRLTSCIL